MSRKSIRTTSRESIARAKALIAAGQLPAAIGVLEEAFAREPDDAVRYALGSAWLEAGEAERAKKLLAEIAGKTFAHKAAKVIAEADAILSAPRAAPNYVRHLFDQFAADYDVRMIDGLRYRAPLILRGLADLVVNPAQGKLDILDLGCGTGLAGAAFKNVASRLDGVDLSPLMIEKARAAGRYDELFIADLELFLATGGRAYDLILAADTLVYLGDLAGVFCGAKTRLKPGGYFLFTVERKDGDGYELGPKRRYRHSDAYLRGEAIAVGLEVMGLMECHPRHDAGTPVEGLAAALLRP